MGFLGKIILLNILWMVTSLPVITVGASTTAMYYVALKLHKDGDVNVFREYFHSFKQNFLQATAAWAVLAILGAVVFLEGRWLLVTGNSSSLVLSYGLIGVGLAVFVLLLYLFPVIAAFANSLKTLIGHAYYFAFHRPLSLAATAAITCLPMYFTMVDAQLFPIYLFVWLLVGFALTAYANSWFYYRLFAPYLAGETAGTMGAGETDGAAAETTSAGTVCGAAAGTKTPGEASGMAGI